MQNEDDDDLDMLSDSDVEDEAVEASSSSVHNLHLTTTTSNTSDHLVPPPRPTSPPATSNEQDTEPIGPNTQVMTSADVTGISGEGTADEPMDDVDEAKAKRDEEASKEGEVEQSKAKRIVGMSSGTTPQPGGQLGVVMGPRKTKIMVRDAAWSTWWAVLYWVRILPW